MGFNDHLLFYSETIFNPNWVKNKIVNFFINERIIQKY